MFFTSRNRTLERNEFKSMNEDEDKQFWRIKGWFLSCQWIDLDFPLHKTRPSSLASTAGRGDHFGVTV
jgi:hypothetical protein